MNETEEIKDRLPIEQLVGSYLPLKKAGRIYKACCPFHQEKTPSFTVSPDRGIFKCFGCGEGGDIFDFVMKIEGLNFPESLELLADRAGVTLPEKKFQKNNANQPGSTGAPRLFSLNDYLARFWHALLIKHSSGKTALDYLQNRGLNMETIELFRIGYAPFGSTTMQTLQKGQFTNSEVHSAGEPQKMQDRIVFPIQDITGKVLGFTGRLLESKNDPKLDKNVGPKYWNTPETPIFIKSKALFAIHLAKKFIQDIDLCILAEGQMDVVMLHQYGYQNTVASSGTALTESQIRLISRFTENLVIAYDQDKAGIEATKRAISLALPLELNVFVITVPDGKDPADCLLKNPEAWKNAYENRQNYLDWLIDQTYKETGINPNQDLDASHKKILAKKLLPWLQQIKNPVELDHYINIVASKLQTETSSLKLALSRNISTLQKQLTEEPIQAQSEPIKDKNENRLEIAYALYYVFQAIREITKIELDKLPPYSSNTYIDLIKKKTSDQKITEKEEKEISIHTEELLNHNYKESEVDAGQALADVLVLVRTINSDNKEQIKQDMSQKIKQAQTLGNQEEVKRLFKDLQNLI